MSFNILNKYISEKHIVNKIIQMKTELEWVSFINSNDCNWETISMDKNLSIEFIREYKDYLDWYIISIFHKLTESFIEEFQDVIRWEWIVDKQILSFDFCIQHKDKINEFIKFKY